MVLPQRQVGRVLVSIQLCLLWISPIRGQQTDSVIRDRLGRAGSLSTAEIADVLRASRNAAAGRTFRVAPLPTAPAGIGLRIGADGSPLFIRGSSGFDTATGHVTVTTLTQYTREPAKYCDGSAAPGEFVVEYEDTGGGWTVSVRHTDDGFEVLTPIFAALKGEVPLQDAGSNTVNGRVARALRAPWQPVERRVEERLPGGGVSSRGTISGGATPPGTVQTLWIDQETLLPLRWSVTMPIAGVPTPVDYGLFLIPDSSIDLTPPADVKPATCVDPRFPPRLRR